MPSTLIFKLLITYIFPWYQFLLNKNLLIYLLLIIFIIILFFSLKLNPVYNEKIEYFFINWLSFVIYIFFYILFFLYLRYLYLGQILDLKINLPKLMNFFIKLNQQSFFSQILYVFLFLILILLWVVIFIKVKKWLEFKIWQIFFYYRFSYHIIDNANSKWEKFDWFLEDIHFKYSFFRFCQKIFFYFDRSKPDDYRPDKIYLFICRYYRFFPLFFLLLFFSLEILLNNFCLHYTFYFLFVYFFLMLWIRLFEGLDYSGQLTQVLIEMLYGEPKIVYVNIKKEEEDFFYAYYMNKKVFRELAMEFIFRDHPIYSLRRFVYCNSITNIDGVEVFNVYVNFNTEKYFEKRNLIIKDGKKFVEDLLDEK